MLRTVTLTVLAATVVAATAGTLAYYAWHVYTHGPDALTPLEARIVARLRRDSLLEDIERHLAAH